eukprot:3318936-Pyramimonas_sp.AAC.1
MDMDSYHPSQAGIDIPRHLLQQILCAHSRSSEIISCQESLVTDGTKCTRARRSAHMPKSLKNMFGVVGMSKSSVKKT